MSIKAQITKKAFTAQPNLEPGGYPARVARIYDLGVQPQRPYKGEPKPPCHEIMIIHELVDAFMVDDDGKELDDKPRWLTQRFKIYPLDNEKANSTTFYKAIDPKLTYEGDWAKLIESPVNVTVVNNYDAKSDRTYDNVGGLSAVRPREAAAMEGLKNEGFFFALDNPQIDLYNKIPAFVQDIIKGNINYKGSKLEALLNGDVKQETPQKEKAPEAPPAEDGDDTNPWD